MEHILQPDYRPQGSELVARYHINPSGPERFTETLEQLFSQMVIGYENSSLSPLPLRVFDIDQDRLECSVAFQNDLFDPGNSAQQLAILSGTLFDDRHIDSMHLLHITWPSHLQAAFPGPIMGIQGIRKILNAYDRPLTAVELHPKLGLKTKDCLEKAYHLWMGGCDMVIEGETMRSEDTTAFAERVSFISKERDNCSKRTGKQKLYIPNISAATITEMQQRIIKADQHQCPIVAFNGPQCGLSALTTLREYCSERRIALLVHHSGSRLFSHQSQFRIAEPVLATLIRHLGADALGPLSHSKSTQKSLTDAFSSDHVSQKNCFPIHKLSHSLEEIEELVKNAGQDQIIEGSVAVYRHPDGLKAGATAFRYAVEAAAQGMDQETAVHKNEALKKALV